MLRLLKNLEITFEAERPRAEHIYAAAKPSSKEPNNLAAVIDAGWVRVFWGRVVVVPDIWHATNRAVGGSKDALKTLLDQIHGKDFRATQAIESDDELAGIISSIEAGQKDPCSIVCQTPSWVASRLWENAFVGESELIRLRRWLDRWVILQYPTVVPGDVWSPSQAEAFRSAAFSAMTSEMSLYHWQDLRIAFIRNVALAQGVPVENIESRIPEVPLTFVNRALWLDHPTLQNMVADTDYCCYHLAGLVRILLADVIAENNGPAVHPTAARLIALATDRPELLLFVLREIRTHPILLAELLLQPTTTAFACLLVARWHAPRAAWDRGLVERDDRVNQAESFADAAAVLGEYLKSDKIVPAEVAALLTWFHKQANPGFIDAGGGSEVLLETLRRELIGVAKPILLAMAESLHGASLERGLGTPEFAALLDLADIGGLSPDLEPTPTVEAYVRSVRLGGYDLSAHRLGIAGAKALFRLASRRPALRQTFLYPLEIGDRLSAAEGDQEQHSVVESVARSLRAHIRILCRAIVGMQGDISDDLFDAVVAAVESGALEHKEKWRVGAFAARFEQSILAPVLDRPLAADLGAALSVLSSERQGRLLAAVLETDEPLLLTQILSFGPPAIRRPVEKRIGTLAPLKAGIIASWTEMQARIDELLAAGAVDAAERYIELDETRQTLGQVPGRESARFRNRLRLYYLRGDWPAIANATAPACRVPFDQPLLEETLDFFQGLAEAKGPKPNYERAERIFEKLFNKRPTVAHASNWFAAKCSQLLAADSFGLLTGTRVQEGRRALAEVERMLASIQSGPMLDEVIECNKGLLLLALGEPSQALAIFTSVPLVQLQTVAAAYRAVALWRLGRRSEALATVDQAEHAYGVTDVTAAARKYFATNSTSQNTIEFSLEDGLLKELKFAMARFRTMHPTDQARVLDSHPEAFDALAIDYVRGAGDSLVSLVPMMRGEQVEDDLTAYIQHFLAARVNFFGWSVADQSRGGFTPKGNPGERDLALMWGNTTLALIEAVVCNRPLSQDSMRADLESHFQKLFGYGDPRLFFHITYSYIEDQESLVTFLETVAESAQPPGLTFKGRDQIGQTDTRPPGFIARYDSDSGEVRVVFLVLNLGQQRQRTAAKLAGSNRKRKSPKSKKPMSSGDAPKA
jgi:tetratricopeptide (TPR) repeat protein